MKNADEYAQKIESRTRSFVSDVRKTSAQNELFRSASDKYIAGVCGGLAERYKIDAALVRVIFIILSLSGSFGFWIYLAMWVFVPVDPAFAGELDAQLDDVPPMPHSGPYVDVPGMDSMNTPPAPPADSDTPTGLDNGSPSANPGHQADLTPPFPKPDTTL